MLKLNLKAESQLAFYETVFGKFNPTTELVKELIGKGVTFELDFHTLRAKFKYHTYKTNLGVSTTMLMKSLPGATSGEGLAVTATKTEIVKWVQELVHSISNDAGLDLTTVPAGGHLAPYSVYLNDFGSSKMTVIKLVKEILFIGLYDATKMVEASAKGPVKIVSYPDLLTAFETMKKLLEIGAQAMVQDKKGSTYDLPTFTNLGVIHNTNVPVQPLVSSPAPPQSVKSAPVPAVINLREAKAIGQKVKGTTAGSVYRCIAYNSRLKVAAKIIKSNDEISLRAEWVTGSDTELQEDLKKLAGFKFSIKGNYASLHLMQNGVPTERVIGSFLFGLGIKWDEVLTFAGDLICEQ